MLAVGVTDPQIGLQSRKYTRPAGGTPADRSQQRAWQHHSKSDASTLDSTVGLRNAEIHRETGQRAHTTATLMSVSAGPSGKGREAPVMAGYYDGHIQCGRCST